MVDPSTREASDVLHKITAIGSRSTTSAQAFVDKIKSLPSPHDWGVKEGHMDNVKAYGSYEEVYNDPVCLAFFTFSPYCLSCFRLGSPSPALRL